MVHHVNPFALVKFSFHIKHGLIHGLSFADLVYEPTVLLILSVLEEPTDIFSALHTSVHGLSEDALNLDLNTCRAIELATGLRELLDGDLLTVFKIYAEPYDGNASFSEETELFESLWTSVTELLFLLVGEDDDLLGRLVLGSLDSRVRPLLLRWTH